jgi:hypothetical protein
MRQEGQRAHAAELRKALEGVAREAFAKQLEICPGRATPAVAVQLVSERASERFPPCELSVSFAHGADLAGRGVDI